MKRTLSPGLSTEVTLRVTEALTVPALSGAFKPFFDMPPVFATAFMVAHVEATCIACIRGHLDDGEHTVGTQVNLSHVAATPVGMDVTASVRLIDVAGRLLEFKVEVWDDAGIIGTGTHQRAVIHVERFNTKVQAKVTR